MKPGEYREQLASGCPWCGEGLVIKRGRYGEFLACSEGCGYTKSIRGRSEYPPPEKPKRDCPYQKCDGSGLIPLAQADGQVVPHAFLHCECYEEPPERYRELVPTDFDYPMSSSFRGYSYQYCGVPDLGYAPPEPEPPEPARHEVIHRHSDMSADESRMLSEHDRALKYLLDKQRGKKTRPQFERYTNA